MAMRVGGYGAGALGVGGGLTYLAAGGGRRPEEEEAEAAAVTTGSTNYVTRNAGEDFKTAADAARYFQPKVNVGPAYMYPQEYATIDYFVAPPYDTPDWNSGIKSYQDK
jgi:hypothetical protein